ncbi:MAG: phosphoribosylaminoimidazolesuccinocarboxamide synthase [Deltaproteobacteria bacterium]|nr:phosphoribosylaminoimidazolesuccinocarboxamide synthase [Deltaproteobacteria bacterium]MBW2020779.1 phosphoribosylaminoimidazolesuccinocarboxamide synthase [Deltaproteobacteria bacterium]MBW2075381.1 phosphoribosylaminoimidazolesuccinocarboxamide synthase [Deltaproteobacteria bacterium]RLB80064.1 MAG: phosphoribosylaminoimidazolesuccinocarboxamide synthase [Deltaproteobacteria bacterium]
MEVTLYDTVFPDLNLLRQGKVRDIYDLGDALLMVATDRISAFDVVMPTPIPGKGRILTQMSRFWFEMMEGIIPNHLITADVAQFPEVCHPYVDMIRDRSMLVRKAEPLSVECIVRGYLSGSGWKSYLESGEVCGITLPEGLKESDRLPEPLFTPSTKADMGAHDENISFKQVEDLLGQDLAAQLKDVSMAIYKKAVAFAAPRGIIIADTKFEFGLIDGELTLIDEILTPDSSRFWPEDTYRPGRPQKSFDKQYVRDYLLSLDWNQRPPAPELPPEVVENTCRKYEEALRRLTGTV